MQSSKKKWLGLMAFTIFLTLAFAIPAAATVGYTTYYVDINDGSCSDVTGTPFCNIQPAINAASAGDMIVVAAGTYTGPLTVNVGVTITGAGEGSTIVDGSAVTTYQVSVTANDVSISGLTLLGNSAPSGTYGFKPSNVSNFSLANVTISDSYRTGVDLNGVNGATISNVTITGTVYGNGIGVTDSNNVALSDITTSGNAWGAIRVSSGGCCYGPGVDNFSISGTNSVAEDLKLYTEIDANGGLISNFDPGQFDYETKNMTQFATWGKTWQAVYYDDLNDAKTAALGYVPTYDSSIKQVSTGDMHMYPDMGLQAAIDHADSGATIYVAAGTYNTTDGVTSQVHVDKDIAVDGEDEATTIFKPTADTGTSGDSRGWFLVDSGIDFDLRDVTLDGTGYKVWQGIRTQGTGFIQHVTFTEIKYNPSTNYQGTAIAAFGTGNVDVFACTFTEIGRVGVLYFGTGINGSSYTYNTYTGKGDGDWLDYALDISAGATVTVAYNTVTNNTGVASGDSSESAGYMVTTFFGAGTNAYIHQNAILNNTYGIIAGYDGSDTSTVDALFNRIVGNDYGIYSTASAINAENNWFGCNGGPGTAGCDSAAAPVDADPWLTLTVTADDTHLDLLGSTNITANTFINSDGTNTEGGSFQLQNGPELTFATDLGQITTPHALTAGKAVSTLTYDAAPAGKATAQATFDNQTASVKVFFNAYGDSVGVYRIDTAGFRLTNNLWYSTPDEMFMFGPAVDDWHPISGDWDGDGMDTIGVYNMDTGQFYLRNSNDYGAPSVKFTWGSGGGAWLPLAGDWNNDGVDTVGLYNPATAEFKLCANNGACDPAISFTYGPATGEFLPVAGDWNGNGTDTIGLYKTDTSAFWLRNSNSSGAVEIMFAFGPRDVAWQPIAGDWNNDGVDSIGLYNDATGGFWLRDTNNYGSPDYRFMFGPAADSWMPLAGDWDNN